MNWYLTSIIDPTGLSDVYFNNKNEECINQYNII